MTKSVTSVCFAIVGMMISVSAIAQSKADLGKQEFDANCAICHGVNGKGTGPYSPNLARNPPDLTQIAKMNQGVFPMARLYELVEGANVPAHGTREMPIWGKEFNVQDTETYREIRGHYDPIALVRARILLLLEYINRLQVR